jgi:DNA repair exonuclease SbcCD ATPase subunit
MPLHSPPTSPSVVAPSRVQVDDDYPDQHSPSSSGIGGVRHHQPFPLHLSFPETYSGHSSSNPYRTMQPQSYGSSTVPRGVSKARIEHGSHCGSEPSHASLHRAQIKLSYHQRSTVPTVSPSGHVRALYERPGSLNGYAPPETGKVMDFEHRHLHVPACGAAGDPDISTCGSMPAFEDDPHDNLAGIVERAGGAVSSVSLSVPYLHLLCIRHRALLDELDNYGRVLDEQALRFQDLQHKERQLFELRKNVDQLTATNSAQTNTLRNRIGDLELEAKRLKEVTRCMEQDGRDFRERVEKQEQIINHEFEEWKGQAFIEHEVAVMEAQEEWEQILMERDAAHHAAMLQTTEEYNISLDEIRHRILRRNNLVTAYALTIQSLHRQLEDEKAVLHRSFDEKHSLLVAFKSEKEALQDSFIAKTTAAKNKFLSQKQGLKNDHAKEKLSMTEGFQNELKGLRKKWDEKKNSMNEAFAREKAEVELKLKRTIETMQNEFEEESRVMKEGFAKEKAELVGTFAEQKKSIEASFENERDKLIKGGEAAKGAWEEDKKRISGESNEEKQRFENIKKHLEDDIEALRVEKRSLEDKNTALQREKVGLEDTRGQLEKSVKAIKIELKDKNSLIKGKEVQFEADRSRFDEVIKNLEAACENMQKENDKLVRVLQDVAEEEEAEEIRSRGDDF